MAISIKSINLQNFRGFEDLHLNLNKYVTCISGHNGTGKSTILAALSNTGEYKKDKTLNNKPFRGEFEKIILGDPNYDKKINSEINIEFENLFEDGHKINSVKYRTAIQNKKSVLPHYRPLSPKDIIELKDIDVKYSELPWKLYRNTGKLKHPRFRLIPKKDKNRDHERKIEWPTFYLGLSRLYPLGEVEENLLIKDLNSGYEDKISKIHKDIMTSSDEYEAVQVTNINGMKTGVLVNTTTYPGTANSAGQDNLGQILSAVFSFEKLKSNKENTGYKGGLLLIDEIDATLHPAAQNKLLNFLLEKSLELDLQIVFTTHSLSLLEYINDTSNDKVTINYLTKHTGQINVVENPKNDYLRRDLMLKLGQPIKQSISVLTEDDTARWYLAHLLNYYVQKRPNTKLQIDTLKMVDCHIGWSSIVSLVKNDFDYFKNYLIIFDTDLNNDDNYRNLEKSFRGTPFKIDENYYVLPAPKSLKNYNIEKIMWEYISNLQADHLFFKSDFALKFPIHKGMISENGPFSGDFDEYTNESKKIKEWFTNYRWICDEAIYYYFSDNEEVILPFASKIEKFYRKSII
ncbi:TPA: AAA family ATPase [Streptococcus agalactiae]|nr:AAA family ATPase [Streptococcus agalactiae]HEN6235472.1 AAA family ATPase [Streptococcus agalactiae]HEN6275523.1 AAA family ATPase [Streptococcus agalactiae]HEN6466049.1 AAA family ATPase [Streptococcus agalactiae]HEN7048087.1 AAA family ATPase [Streptococcus agalactiae]